MFSAPFLSTLLDRMKAVVRRVAGPVGACMRLARFDQASAPAPIPPVLRALAKGWLRTKLRALSALMRRIEAGETLERPVQAQGAPRSGHVPVVQYAVPPEERLPRGFGWMCAFGPFVRGDGAAFAEWLNAPHMQAMVRAAPERMARAIGPILNATGERNPAWFPAVSERLNADRRGGCGESDEVLAAAAGCAESRGAAEVDDAPVVAPRAICCWGRSTPGGRNSWVATTLRGSASARPVGVAREGISKMRRTDTAWNCVYFVTISKHICWFSRWICRCRLSLRLARVSIGNGGWGSPRGWPCRVRP